MFFPEIFSRRVSVVHARGREEPATGAARPPDLTFRCAGLSAERFCENGRRRRRRELGRQRRAEASEAGGPLPDEGGSVKRTMHSTPSAAGWGLREPRAAVGFESDAHL